jgi:hypothetical protein
LYKWIMEEAGQFAQLLSPWKCSRFSNFWNLDPQNWHGSILRCVALCCARSSRSETSTTVL